MAEWTVADVMDADPATVSVDDDARKVIELLSERELPGVPVIDADRRVVGIVTEADLVIRESEADLHLPYFVNLLGGIVFLGPMKGFEERLRKAFATRVTDLMTRHPVTCSPDEDVHSAAKTITQKHHNRLPVVDREGRLVGVVTRADVLTALIAEE